MSANGNLTAKQRAVLTVFADGSARTEWQAWSDVVPRPSSPVFGHLRKLTDRGYLTRVKVGRYVYSITDEGRKALAA